MDAKAIRLFVDKLEAFTKCRNFKERDDLEHLVSYIICCSVNNFTSDEVEKVVASIYLSAKHHAGIKRASGESYITHPLSVAYYFMVLGLCDFKLTVAAILHDVVEDKPNKKARTSSKMEIVKIFGEEIKDLVKLVTKKFCLTKQEDYASREIHFTRLIESEDWRAMILKIGDRWHNLKTIQDMPLENQTRKIRETFTYFPSICSILLSLLDELEKIAEYEQKKTFEVVRKIVFRFQKDLNNYEVEQIK